MVILLNSQSTELIFRKYIMSVVWLLSNDLSRQKHKDVGLWRRYIHVIVIMGAMCAGNPPNFRPMMCNASVMVVRIWKLHSMHIFVPHLITLLGTNWIRGQHPPILCSAIITHAWTHGAHSYIVTCHIVEPFRVIIAEFSPKKREQYPELTFIWVGIMAPLIIAR